MKIQIYKDGILYAEFDADTWVEEWEHVDAVAQEFLVVSKEKLFRGNKEMTDFEQVTVQQTCMSCGEEIEAKFSEMTAWQFTKKHTRHCICSVCNPTSNWKRMIVVSKQREDEHGSM